jgi:ubiquitin carboxyl-terminal hydrolase 9/13
VQCLYYSAPFREQVINFPTRSPYASLKRKSAAISSLEEASPQNGLSPIKTKILLSSSQASSSPRTKQAPAPSAAGQQAPKQEENKDSPEYKKRLALAAGPVLTMNYENSNAYGMPESLFASLKDIFEAVIAHDSRIGVVSPVKFLEILRRDNEMFRTPMHQDAHEFLNLLLNQVVENVEQFTKSIEEKKESKADQASETGLATALSPVINSSLRGLPTKGPIQSSRWVHELFEGTLTSETRCLTCENISQRDEAFLDLSVDLEMHTSVTSCLRRFSEEEMLCERNKFHCDNCGGLQEAEKRMKIKRLPKILALHLKRFKYTEDMQRLAKLFHRVLYPFYLRLFNTTDDAEDPDRLYELYAVVVHIGGGPYHGHYVSIIKTEDRGWLLFDDEMVEPVDKKFVMKFFGEGVDRNGHPLNLACAYVLFYQETTLEAMQRELASEGVTPVPEAQKEPSFAHAKTNGVAIPNGVIHSHSPSTPLSEDLEQFASIDRATTITGPVLPPAPFQTPLETVHTSPASPALPFMKRRKSMTVFNAKKEQEKLEKEEKERRKAEEKERERLEKEAEKQAKQKKKEQEAIRKEAQKRQDEEVAARYKAAGKTSSNASSSRAGDEESFASSSNRGSALGGLGIHDDQHHHLQHAHTQPLYQNHLQPPTSHPKENGFATAPTNGGTSGSMLHRFRNTSMSMKKPKFWSKEKDKSSKPKSSGDHSDLSREAFAFHQDHGSWTASDTGESSTATGSSAMGSPELGGMSHSGPSNTSGPVRSYTEKPAKKESRFHLGRKKSVMGL